MCGAKRRTSLHPKSFPLQYCQFFNGKGVLQRFALKPKPRKILKALRSNAFKIFLVARLIGNCCKTNLQLAFIMRIATVNNFLWFVLEN
jgi:hypothetical protein